VRKQALTVLRKVRTPSNLRFEPPLRCPPVSLRWHYPGQVMRVAASATLSLRVVKTGSPDPSTPLTEHPSERALREISWGRHLSIALWGRTLSGNSSFSHSKSLISHPRWVRKNTTVRRALLAGNTLHATGLRVAQVGCEPTSRIRFPEPKRLNVRG